MTDEEMAVEYANKNVPTYTFGYRSLNDVHYDVKQAFLSGLKAGKPKWHDLQKDPNDLPLNADPILCLGSTGYIVCKYISGSWVDNQTVKLVPKYINIYKWYKLKDTEG